MISRIKQLQLDAVTALNSISVDGKKLFKYVNFWNSQVDDMITGEGYDFKTPAAFVEFIPGPAKLLGAGMTSFPESIVNIHIVDELLNARADVMERNEVIFDIRDCVMDKFNRISLSFCSNLMPISDVLSYRHDNVYKYVQSYSTNFIDNKGSIFDVERNGRVWATLTNPTLEIVYADTSYVDEIGDEYENELGIPYIYS